MAPALVHPTQTCTFAFLGRLTPEKGLEDLLAALSNCTRPNYRLLIAGDGDAGYVASLRRKYPDPRLEWLGWVETSDVYTQAHWVVVPSVWEEPLARVLLEAQVHGCPVIASARGGTPELIEDGRTGLIYEPDDEHALCKTLERVLENPTIAVRMRAAIETCSEDFAPAQVARNLHELYMGTLAECRSDTTR